MRSSHVLSFDNSFLQQYISILVPTQRYRSLQISDPDLLMSSLYDMHAGHGITGSKNIYSSKVHIGNWRQDIIGQELVKDLLNISSEIHSTGVMNHHNSIHSGKITNTRNKRNTYLTSSQEIGSKLSYENTAENSINLQKQKEAISRNKEGLNYSLLFSHANNGKDISHSNRYTSNNRLSSSHHLFRNKCEGSNVEWNFDDNFPKADAHFIGTYKTRDTYTNKVLSNNDSVFPPVDRSHTNNKAKIIKNTLDLDSKNTTTARLANKHFTQYLSDRTSSPYTAIGRSEFLPSARR